MPEFKVIFSFKLIHFWPINLMFVLGTLGMGRNLMRVSRDSFALAATVSIKMLFAPSLVFLNL